MGKLIAAVLVLVIGIIAVIYVVNPYQVYKETSFKTFYDSLSQSIEKLDCAAVYSMKSEKFQDRTAFDYYVLSCENAKKYISVNIEVHSIWVKGNTGYVDRTLISCTSTKCVGNNRIEKRETKKYNFINGKWTLPDDDDPLIH